MAISGAWIGEQLLGVFEDITDRRNMEDARETLETQLRESQKMEAIGTLAGGIAHDFNNLLAVIIGNVTLAEDSLPANLLVQSYLKAIGEAASRAKSTVQQILTFSHKHVPEQVTRFLRPVLEEALKLLRFTLPAGIELDISLRERPLAVSCDANQIGQVLMNLCTNAWHAMEDDAGRIEIKLDQARIDAETGQKPEGLADGDYAKLLVRDNGRGMDEATRERIFQPFFTTKDVGKGTGLGLSVVYGIVKAHHGAIDVRSAPGEGTSVAIYLPLTETPEASGEKKPATSTVRGNGQRVLYVDDEVAMVLLVQRMLDRSGFTTRGFTDAREAVDAVRADPHGFDIVVTDFNMPDLTGIAVATEVRRLRPDLPVLITAGYITDELRASAVKAGVRQIVFKPNIVDELCPIIHDLLSAKLGTGLS